MLASEKKEVRVAIERSFCVDSWLQSVPTAQEAQSLLFNILQWVFNIPGVIRHLPLEAKPAKQKLWLSQNKYDSHKYTLVLSWHNPIGF